MSIKDIAGILIIGEQQRQINSAQDNAARAREQAAVLEAEKDILESRMSSTRNEVQELDEENTILLQQNRALKNAYAEQQELTAEWMVSQKAFKELAIQFGFEQGKTPEEVIDMGLAKKKDVLDSKHDPKHNTNANNSERIKPYIDKLKSKINQK